MPPSAPDTSAPALQRNACSLPGGIALAAAAMAPALAVVLNAPAAAPAAGGALPLSFLLAFVVCLLVGNTVVTFARRLPPSAGSFYAYNARGLGAGGGFVTGWLLAFGYAVLAPGLFTALGDFAAAYARTGLGIEAPWWCFSLAGLALVVGLSLRSVRASVRVDLVLLVVELGVFMLLAGIVLYHVGGERTLAGFSVRASPSGWSGVGVGVVFGILSFIGFDAAATLGEETRDARRTVPLAVGGTLAVCGLFYLVTVSAMATGDLSDPNPFLALARTHAPWLEHAVALCGVACLFSCFLAVHTTTARIVFAMGRDRVLPGVLGRVHPRWHSPHVAVCAQGAFTLAVGLPLGVWLGPGPAGAYGFTGAVGAVAIILVWMLGGIALIRYSVRAGGYSPVRHIVVPMVGVLALAYPLWAVADADDAPGQMYRSYWVPAVVLAWLVVGLLVYLGLRLKAPHKLRAVGSALADESTPPEPTRIA
ncbi:APC family permease [Frigoriglobus tundricola]|uniref:Putative amino acid permease, GabP family n=1 Tax=Frigoriglobus tundricola TaxID=2774151 RepID=A0A6M5Z3U1_9BACT|nr:APC family permease [Frigoriglobus tundricola]QJX01090.1 putative amino acid permease, GabP family [Frigoriglobus tundricola]